MPWTQLKSGIKLLGKGLITFYLKVSWIITNLTFPATDGGIEPNISRGSSRQGAKKRQQCCPIPHSPAPSRQNLTQNYPFSISPHCFALTFKHLRWNEGTDAKNTQKPLAWLVHGSVPETGHTNHIGVSAITSHGQTTAPQGNLSRAQCLLSAERCNILAFWDRNHRILNSNTKLLKRTEVVTLHSNITVLYVGKKKRICLSSKENQKFLSFAIQLVSVYISAALYCSEYQRHYWFLFLKTDLCRVWHQVCGSCFPLGLAGGSVVYWWQ